VIQLARRAQNRKGLALITHVSMWRFAGKRKNEVINKSGDRLVACRFESVPRTKKFCLAHGRINCFQTCPRQLFRPAIVMGDSRRP